MKNTIQEIGNAFTAFFQRFGFVIFLTVLSYIIRIMFTEGLKRVLRNLVKIPMAALIGLPCYIFLVNHTELANDTCVAITCISCAFTGEIYDGLLKMIRMVPELLKKFFDKKIDKF